MESKAEVNDDDPSLLDLTASIDEILNLSPESDDGNIEYKRQLLDLTDYRKNRLITQMIYRLDEGEGECFYQLGINDNGTPFGLNEEEFSKSLENLKYIASKSNANISMIEEKTFKKDLKIAKIMIRHNTDAKIDIKIAIIGNVNSSKSTLIGVLHSGQADNGRGSARKYVLTHPHERATGQTSDESAHITGFSSNGKHISSHDEIKDRSWKDIFNLSSKIISITDLCGHEDYFHTTIRGLIGTHHDYALVLVESTRGVQLMTKQHVALCEYFRLPYIIIVTKIDLCKDKPEVLRQTLKDIEILVKSGPTKHSIQHIRDKNDILTIIQHLESSDSRYPVIPIISISNTEMTNIDLLLEFLNLLPRRIKFDSNTKALFSIKKIYMTKSGIVVYGFLVSGSFRKGDKAIIGPDSNGNYLEIKLKDMEWHRAKVDYVKAGSSFTFNIVGKGLKRDWIKRGMVVLPSDSERVASSEFDALIYITKKVTSTISLGTRPSIYYNNIRQNCTIDTIYSITRRNGELEELNVCINTDMTRRKKKREKRKMGEEITIRGGDRALVKLTFEKPVYLQEKGKFALREDKINGIGMIKKIY